MLCIRSLVQVVGDVTNKPTYITSIEPHPSITLRQHIILSCYCPASHRLQHLRLQPYSHITKSTPLHLGHLNHVASRCSIHLRGGSKTSGSTTTPPSHPLPPQHRSTASKHKPVKGPTTPRNDRSLPNLGNTCFINAIIQSLRPCTAIVHQLTQLQHPPQSIGADLLTLLTHQSHQQTRAALSNLKRQAYTDCQWTLHSQQDALEFLQWLIIKLPPLQQLFQLHLHWVDTCSSCSNIQTKTESDTVLLIPPMHVGSIQNGITTLLQPQHHCRQHGICTATSVAAVHVLKPPCYLAVCLLRQQLTGKVTAYIYPDVQITLGGFQYQLVSIVEHSGKLTTHGHYTAYATTSTGQWTFNDDQEVQLLSTSRTRSPQVYIAIYEQYVPGNNRTQPTPFKPQRTIGQTTVTAPGTETATKPLPKPATTLVIHSRSYPPEPQDTTLPETSTYHIYPQHISQSTGPADRTIISLPYTNMRRTQTLLDQWWPSHLHRGSIQVIIADDDQHHLHEGIVANLLPYLAKSKLFRIATKISLPYTPAVCRSLDKNWKLVSHFYELHPNHITSEVVHAKTTPSVPHLLQLVTRNSNIHITNTTTPSVIIANTLTHDSCILNPHPVAQHSDSYTTISAHSNNQKLVLSSTVEKLLPLLDTNPQTPHQSHPCVTDIAQALYTTHASVYTVGLCLSATECLNSANLTPPNGHCSMLALHQIITSSPHPLIPSHLYPSTAPAALDLQRPADRLAYEHWLEYMLTISKNQAAQTIAKILNHLQAHPTHVTLPQALWFDGTMLTDIALPTPITVWARHQTSEVCRPTLYANVPLTPHGSASINNITTILLNQGNLLFANRHFSPLHQSHFNLTDLMEAIGNLAQQLVDHIQGVTRLPLTTPAHIDLTSNSSPSHSPHPAPIAPTHQLSPTAPTLAQLLSSPPPSLRDPSTASSCFPSLTDLVKMQHLLTLTKVISAPQYGGRSLVATTRIQKHQLLGYYGGTFTTRDKATNDTYLVQGLVNGESVIIDGTPTPFHLTDGTKFGLINEYIWHHGGMDSNVRLTHDLQVIATQPIKVGQHLYLNYGAEYNWIPVIFANNLPVLCSTLLSVVTDHQPCFLHPICNLIRQIRAWTTTDLHHARASSDRLTAIVYKVVTGQLLPTERHLHFLTAATNPEDLVEMVLSNEVVYRRIAFRFAHNPTPALNPSLNLLCEHSVPLVPAVVPTQRRGTRRRFQVVNTLQLNSDPLPHLTPFPGPQWIPRIQLDRYEPHSSAPILTMSQYDNDAAVQECPTTAHTSTQATQDPPNQSSPIDPLWSSPVHFQDVPSNCASPLPPTCTLQLGETAPLPPHPDSCELTVKDHCFQQHRNVLPTPRHMPPPQLDPVSPAIPSQPSTPSKHLHSPIHPSDLSNALPTHPTTNTSVTTSPAANAHTQGTSQDDVVSQRPPTCWLRQYNEDEDNVASAPSTQDTPVSRLTISQSPSHTNNGQNPDLPPCHQPPPPPFSTDREPTSTQRRINKLNIVADKLAPQKRRKARRDNLITTYTHNIGGLSEEKLTDIADVIMSRHIDVTVLLDVRITENNVSYTIRTIKHLLLGFHVVVHPTLAAGNGSKIGGAIVIAAPRVRHKSITQLTPLGALIEIKGAVGQSKFAHYAIYIPCKAHTGAQGSLYTKIASELEAQAQDTNCPYQFIKEQLYLATTKSLAERRHTTLAGDFNATMTPDDDPHNLLELLRALPLAKRQPSNTTNEPTYSSGGKHTSIDHFFTSAATTIQSLHIHRSTMFQTDHAALLVSLSLPHQSPRDTRWTLPLKQLRKKLYDPTDPVQVIELTTKLSQLAVDQQLDPATRIYLYTQQSMDLVAQLQPTTKPNRHKPCKYWCPDNVALEVMLRLVVKLKGLLRRSQLNPKSLAAATATTLERLTKVAKQDNQQVAHFNTLSLFSLPYWTTIEVYDPAALAAAIATGYTALKRKLRAGLRIHRRKEFLTHKLKIETEYQVGKTRAAIAYSIGSKMHAYRLETLLIDGETVVDPGIITHTATRHFEEWFTPHHPKSIEQWTHTLTNHNEFLKHSQQCNVPQIYADAIWEAVSYRPPANEQQRRFLTNVARCPTYEQFAKALKAKPKQTSGGISGLTYDIMKCWPEAVKRDVHQACSQLWEDKAVPDQWKHRWVHLIPKVDNPTLDQLRPICLLEVTRKLWIGLIIEVIADHLYSDGVLTPGQQSGKHRGTDAGSAELTAVLETAKRAKSQLFISSWDVKRAFDSVARGILLFSWTRLGVPTDIAEYLIRLDAEAIMVVKTPLSLLIHHEEGYAGLTSNQLTFHPQQGTPQGGNEASLGYIGFSDILLRALTEAGTNDFMMLDIHDTLHPTLPNAYVDDLNSVSASYQGLQKKANIVSAFALIFAIKLNASKFRAFHINWGNSHAQAPSECLVVYGEQWTPTSVTLATDGTITHLGLMRDCDGSDITQYYALRQKTVLALDKLVKSPISVGAKLAILKSVIYARIRYVGKGMSWRYHASDRSYLQFDKLIFSAVRKITHNRPSFPSALIEVATSQGGLGLDRISVDCQLAKLEDMKRAFRRSPSHQATMLSLLNNVLKSTNQPVQANTVTLESVAYSDTWWFTSAAEFLQSVGMTISVNPKRGCTPPPRNEVLSDVCQQHHATLYLYSIANKAELYMEGDAPSPRLEALILALDAQPVPRQPIQLRSDQTWIFTINGEQQIHQLMGKDSHDRWQTVRWMCLCPEVNNTIHLPDGVTALVGAGGTHSVYEKDICAAAAWLLTIDKECYCKNGGHTSRILDKRSRTPAITDTGMAPSQPPRPPYQVWLADSRNHHLYTDGSFKLRGSPQQRLLDEATTVCQSSVVKRDSNGAYSYMAITNDCLQHDSAFTTEIIAQLAALRYGHGTVHTDCKGAMAALENPTSHSHQLVQLVPAGQAQRLQHVKAHPERRESPRNFSDNDRGIFLADMVAGGNIANADQLCGETHAVILSDITLVSDLSRELQYPYISNKDGSLATQSPLRRHQYQVHQAYLENRDQYKFLQLSARPNPSPQWTGTSFAISGKLFAKVKQGARRCQIQRIVYDWHFTGRNRFKASNIPEDMRCSLCLHCQEDQTHIVWHCSHPDMAQLRAEHCALLSSTMLNSIGKSDDTAFQNALASLHTSLMHPPHVSLLLGRVHAHQRSLLNFPSLKVIHLPMLVDTWKNYAAFAVDMYSMRQQLIAHTTGLMPKVFKSVVGSRVLAAREALIGIEATTLLHSDGTRVVSSGYDKDTVIIAHKRGKLDVLNCQVARSLQRPKRKQDPTKGPPLPPPKHRTEAPTEE